MQLFTFFFFFFEFVNEIIILYVLQTINICLYNLHKYGREILL